jgi:polyisoprenoid-binding protein YceI
LFYFGNKTEMMKGFLIILFQFTFFHTYGQTPSPATVYLPVDEGSKVRFVIKNFGINTGGTMDGLNGTINFNPDNLASTIFNVSVDTKTVDTDIEARDNHLRKAEYFDAEKYPKLIFQSTKITKTNKPEYLYMYGNLTIKGVTKEVKFPFTYTLKSEGYLFEGEFEINRRDFGVGGSSFSLSDNVVVQLSVFAKKNSL